MFKVFIDYYAMLLLIWLYSNLGWMEQQHTDTVHVEGHGP